MKPTLSHPVTAAGKEVSPVTVMNARQSHVILEPVQPRAALAVGLEWFQPAPTNKRALKLGLRLTPGGVHLSKTMMLKDLSKIPQTVRSIIPAEIRAQVLEANILGKRTGTARRQALEKLNALYGILTPHPVTMALSKLWPRRPDGHPLLALLCCLAREPLLRDSAPLILSAGPGDAVHWLDIAAQLGSKHPGRYSPKTLGSLARNCASSWTQAGLLSGKVRKRRATPIVTPENAAYAALLGSLAGFGGPALLASPWMRVLDRSEAELLNLLRAADGLGLLRLRVAGGIIDLNIIEPMADALGVPDLVNG